MKKYYSLLASLLLSLSLVSQSKSDFGPSIEIDKRGYLPKIVAESDDDLYAVDTRGDEIYIESFDKKSLNSNFRKELELVDEEKTVENLERVVYLKDEIVSFVTHWAFGVDQFNLIAQYLDPKTGARKKRKVVFEKPIDRNHERGSYNIYLSKNKKRVLVHTYTYYDESEKTIENLVLMDENLEVITEREYANDGKRLNLTNNLLVDDEGSVYFFRNGAIVILDAFNNFEEWTEDLPSDDLAVGAFYSNVNLALNDDLDLVVTAYYVTKDFEDQPNANKAYENTILDDTQVEGIVYFKINTLDKELSVVRLNNFEEEFIDLFKTQEDLEENYEPEIKDKYSLNRVVNLDNGEVLLLGEKYREMVLRDQHGSIIGRRYYYGDIMMIHFDAEGTVLWKDRLPKNQLYYWGASMLGYVGSHGYKFFSRPAGIGDYFFDKVIVNGDMVYLIYNDIVENNASNSYTLEMLEFDRVKDAVPVVQTIDLKNGTRNGEIRKSISKLEFGLKPASMYESKLSDEVYYFIANKKAIHLARMSFK